MFNRTKLHRQRNKEPLTKSSHIILSCPIPHIGSTSGNSGIDPNPESLTPARNDQENVVGVVGFD
jgi:hypothetical protein